jgi:hypothetical protein
MGNRIDKLQEDTGMSSDYIHDYVFISPDMYKIIKNKLYKINTTTFKNTSGVSSPVYWEWISKPFTETVGTKHGNSKVKVVARIVYQSSPYPWVERSYPLRISVALNGQYNWIVLKTVSRGSNYFEIITINTFLNIPKCDIFAIKIDGYSENTKDAVLMLERHFFYGGDK